MHVPTLLATLAFTAFLSTLPMTLAAAIDVTHTPIVPQVNTAATSPLSNSTSANEPEKDTLPAAFPSNPSTIVILDARSVLNETASPLGTTGYQLPMPPRSWDGHYGVSCLSGHQLSRARCLDIDQSNLTDESAKAQMWRCNKDSEAQGVNVLATLDDHWQGRAYRIIRSWNHMYCLDVPGGHAFQGQTLRWWKCNYSDAQKWHTYHDELGQTVFSIKGHEMKLCLDPAGGFGGNRNGQRLQLWPCHRGPEQRWYWTDFDSGRSGVSTCE